MSGAIMTAAMAVAMEVRVAPARMRVVLRHFASLSARAASASAFCLAMVSLVSVNLASLVLAPSSKAPARISSILVVVSEQSCWYRSFRVALSLSKVLAVCAKASLWESSISLLWAWVWSSALWTSFLTRSISWLWLSALSSSAFLRVSMCSCRVDLWCLTRSSRVSLNFFAMVVRLVWSSRLWLDFRASVAWSRADWWAVSNVSRTLLITTSAFSWAAFSMSSCCSMWSAVVLEA